MERKIIKAAEFFYKERYCLNFDDSESSDSGDISEDFEEAPAYLNNEST